MTQIALVVLGFLIWLAALVVARIRRSSAARKVSEASAVAHRTVFPTMREPHVR